MKKLFSFFLPLLLIIFCGCNGDSKKQTTVARKAITEKNFGTFKNVPVIEYSLENTNGMQVGILNYGGTVTKIFTKDKMGELGDVVLGYNSIEGYIQKSNPYFGSLVGRYGNRIAKGKFTLSGTNYVLAGNDHGQSLHGGNIGYDKVMWQAEKQPGDSSLKLTYLSKDGEEGYPGNLSVEVLYTLTDNNELKIEYSATSDKPTPVNLTSHCYFNLSGGKDSTILGHDLLIKAAQYTEVDSLLIPTGNLPEVKNTSMDFTSFKQIGKDIASVKGGYDHNWVLNKHDGTKHAVAALHHAASGRYMEVFTTEPGLQFYSGNFLDGTLADTKNKSKYVKYAALCLEAQHFPDSPNQPSFPNTILEPGKKYSQITVYKFSIK